MLQELTQPLAPRAAALIRQVGGQGAAVTLECVAYITLVTLVKLSSVTIGMKFRVSAFDDDWGARGVRDRRAAHTEQGRSQVVKIGLAHAKRRHVCIGSN